MPSFKTQYKKFKRAYSNPGERLKYDYREVIDEDGKFRIEPDGVTDIQEFIEASADSVDINNIIDRYIAGDESAFEKLEGMYADVSGMPRNLMDIMNINLRVEQAFNELPNDIKNVYGNNYLEFLANPDKYQPANDETANEVKEFLSNDEPEQ